MSHHWKDKQRRNKECAGPSCPASGSKPKRKKYHEPPSKPPKPPKYDKPPSDWTASTTPKAPPAPPGRRASYSVTGGAREGNLGGMDLPGGKPITTKSLQAMRKAAGTVIKYKGKVINPKARTQ